MILAMSDPAEHPTAPEVSAAELPAAPDGRIPVRSILVDIDSTLYPMGPLLRKHLRLLFGISMEEHEVDVWNFWTKAGVSLEDGLRIIAESHADAEILTAVPFAGVVETIGRWQADGAVIHVVSDRLPSTHAATLAWIEKIGLRPDHIALADRIDKLAYVLEHGIDLAIDDKPAFLESLIQARVPAASLVYPYNATVLAAHDEIMAADDWPALSAVIESRVRIGDR